MALSIKKGDRVRVRAGKDKGLTSRVLEVIRDERGRAVKVLVEHANMIRRHTKQSQKRQGGIIEREAAIDASNVMLVDSKSDTATRFGADRSKEGGKIRVSKSSGNPL